MENNDKVCLKLKISHVIVCIVLDFTSTTKIRKDDLPAYTNNLERDDVIWYTREKGRHAASNEGVMRSL